MVRRVIIGRGDHWRFCGDPERRDSGVGASELLFSEVRTISFWENDGCVAVETPASVAASSASSDPGKCLRALRIHDI